MTRRKDEPYVHGPHAPRGVSDAEWIMHYTVVDPESGCWLWQRHVDRDGYARGERRSTRGERQPTRGVHRLSYEAFVGPIPTGHTLDHACHNRDETCPGGSECLHRRCLNPDHLEPLTVAENLRRSPYTPAGRKLRREIEALVLAGFRPDVERSA